MSYGDFEEGADSRYEGLLITDGPLTMVASITQNEYQGDDYWVVKGEDGRYGYLNIGWGSCSGCDAYEHAEGYAYNDETKAKAAVRLAQLRDDLIGEIHWEDDLPALLAWMDARDWGATSYVKREKIQPLIDAAAKHV